MVEYFTGEGRIALALILAGLLAIHILEIVKSFFNRDNTKSGYQNSHRPRISEFDSTAYLTEGLSRELERQQRELERHQELDRQAWLECQRQLECVRQEEQARRREQQRIQRLRADAVTHDLFASHPVFRVKVDVSRVRQPEERWIQQLEKWLIDNGGKDGKYLPVEHFNSVKRWQQSARERLALEDDAIKDIRQTQYTNANLAANTCTVVFVERQKDRKTGRELEHELFTKRLSARDMQAIVAKLVGNGNRTTIKAEHAKSD